jgi:hypothetical protein
MLYEHVGCFRLVVFWIGTLCLILMLYVFFCYFFGLNMFVYDVVTCWDKKNMF